MGAESDSPDAGNRKHLTAASRGEKLSKIIRVRRKKKNCPPTERNWKKIGDLKTEKK